MDSSSGFISFYRKLPLGNNTVRFFDKKEFHSVYGENALFIARNYYKTTSVVKYIGSDANPLPCVNLNKSLFESVLRDLLIDKADHTVEIYESNKGSTSNMWKMTKTASPGNFAGLEGILFRSNDMAETPLIMSATVVQREQQKFVGIAYSDSGKRELFACEIIDDDQLCTLESIAVQIGARECVIPEAHASTSVDHKKLLDVMTRCGILVSERSKKSFDDRNLESDLSRLLISGNVEQHRDVIDKPLASQALTAILSFAELTSDVESINKWNLELYKTGKFMRLDAAAMQALHVMPLRGDANTAFSIYGLLCRAKTAMGKRLLRSWLKQPLLDIEEIKVRHDIVDTMVSDSILREDVRSRMRGMPDIERLARNLERGRTDLGSLCQLYRASGQLSLICSALRNSESPERSQLLGKRYCEPLEIAHDGDHLGKFDALIEAAVDLDKIPDEYLICASYDPILGELEEQRSELLQEIEEEASKVSSDLGMSLGKQIKLERSNHQGHYLRITKKEETAVRKKLQGQYYQIETRKDGVKFVSNKLRRLSDSFAALSAEYAKKQTDLVAKVVAVAQGYTSIFEAVSGTIAELDVLIGFAEVALDAPMQYVRPEMLPMGQGDIILEDSRHPCVEAQDGVSFIPNTCDMRRDTSWFQIITGPNMGGKSTFIRQAGVCVLMAQVGSFVPCSKADISIRDAIFARVGAGDCQIRGVSTFMAEMLETAVILKAATANSLIIIDELGRGTSTYDGFGLAWSISEHICTKIRAPCLFATHFHELTSLGAEQECGSVANLHVETSIDQDTKRLTMLYRLVPGACDQSFGIHVAEFANFPPEVIQMAREKAAEIEDFSQPSPAHEAGVDEEDDFTIGGKRKRIEPPNTKAELAGVEKAKKFLADFANLPMDSMSYEEALDKTRELLKNFQDDCKDVQWLQELF